MKNTIEKIANVLVPRTRNQSDMLEFGCGPNVTPGYLGVDVRRFPGVRYVCNAWEIDKHVSKNSITKIYSRHFFEHLTFPQAKVTLLAWQRILKSSGTVQIIVPDIKYHIEQFLNPDTDYPSETNPQWTVREHALAGFWGWQREGETKLWDVHKSGYDFRLMEEILKNYGFINILRIDDSPWNLNVSCQKE